MSGADARVQKVTDVPINKPLEPGEIVTCFMCVNYDEPNEVYDDEWCKLHRITLCGDAKPCADYKPDKRHQPTKEAKILERPIKWVEYYVANEIIQRAKANRNKTYINTRKGKEVITYVYNAENGTYSEDESFSVMNMVTSGIIGLLDDYLQNIKAKGFKDSEAEERALLAYHKIEKKYLSGATINSIVNLVSKLSARSGVEFDQEKRYLNSANCVYDLDTDSRIQHSDMFYFKKAMPTNIVDNAECPEFDALLNYMFDNDQDMIEFYLEVHASGLRGTRNDEYFFFIQGVVADNGKTTAEEAITYPLGIEEDGYAVWLDIKAFTKQRSRNATQPELLQAIDKRLAILDEPDREEWDVAQVKNTTNFSKMSLRGLWEKTKGHGWTATIICLCNRMPTMDLKDAGAMRRVVVIPVEKQITEEMKKAERKYKYGRELKYGEYLAVNESEGIVRKLLAAYKNYKDRGYRLPPMPKKVREATDAYIKKNNPVKRYLDDKCTSEVCPDDSRVSPKCRRGKEAIYNAAELHDDFLDYCEIELHMEKRYLMTVANIIETMEGLGHPYKVVKNESTNQNPERVYVGIRKKYSFEPKEVLSNQELKEERSKEDIEEIKIRSVDHRTIVKTIIESLGAGKPPIVKDGKTLLTNPADLDEVRSVALKEHEIKEKEFNKTLKELLKEGQITNAPYEDTIYLSAIKL